MKVEQCKYKHSIGWKEQRKDASFKQEKANLTLVFGKKELLNSPDIFEGLKRKYPNSDIILSSTAGEIIDVNVDDDSIVSTAIYFEKTNIRAVQVHISDYKNSFNVGQHISNQLNSSDLRHILVFSDGQMVNGSELVIGLNSEVAEEVMITGGLAGDGANFTETLVGLNGKNGYGNVVAVGFYGQNFSVSCGSKGGWDEFGPHRIVSKSKDNVLYELNGQSALDLYKKYLGPQAEALPGSALLFPLSMKVNDDDEPVVRTILSINEEEKSMTFAGDIPKGAIVRLMKANFDRLIDGASQAALDSKKPLESPPELVLLISCVGRKLVLDQRIEEEIEAVEEVFGKDAYYTGFYSYGEISPSKSGGHCDLHNQTMTLTTYREL